MLLERGRIVAADHEGDVAAGKAARLALERHARVGDGGELGLQAALPFDARNIAMLLERQEGVPAADIDVVKGGVDDRAIVEDRAALPREDRKSVVSGKSVSVRVDLGGRRIIKKKTTSKNNNHPNIHTKTIQII